MSKILVLTPRFPFPTLSGDKVRIYHLSRMLARRHKLTLLSFCEKGSEPDIDPPEPVFDTIHRVPLRRWRAWMRCALSLPTSTSLQLAYYRSSQFKEVLDELLPEHDLVLAHLLRTGQYVEKANIPCVLEMTDALSMTYDRVLEQEKRRGLKEHIYSIEANRVRRCEARMVRQFDLTTVVSSVDKAYLQRQAGDTPSIEVYTNGVDLNAFTEVGAGKEPAAVFVGNMRTAQNQDACRHFIKDILPRIRKTIPDFRFRIIGASPPGVSQLFEHDYVDFIGRVESIPEAVRGALCGVCPMRIGAGVQNKVLEYMAMALPTVISRVGFEGLDAEPGAELLVGDSPEALAEHIVQLYHHESLQQALGQRARQFVRDHHRWAKVLGPFVEAIGELIEETTDVSDHTRMKNTKESGGQDNGS